MADTLLERYDIYYTNQTPVSLGFMLAKGKTGAKLWRRDDQRGLPDSFAYGDIAYANLAPDVQKVIAHKYFHGGIGALEFEQVEYGDWATLQSLRSQNIDTRCKGKVYPGPKIVSMTTPNVSNGDSTMTLRPNGNGSETAITHQEPDAGSHYEKVDEAVADDDTTYVWHQTAGASAWKRDLYALPASGGSGTISQIEIFFCVREGTVREGNNAKPSLRTHGSTTDGNAKFCDNTWRSYSQVWTENPYTGEAWTWPEIDALEIGVSLFACGGADNRQAWCTQVYVEVTYSATFCKAPFAVFNGKLYLGRGKKLCRLNVDTHVFDEVGGAPPPFDNVITHLETWGDYLFIALGGANKYYYMSTAEVFTLSNIASGEAERLCRVGTDLWQLKLPNKIKKSSNPINGGSWGAEIAVGGVDTKVNDMQSHDEYLYCLKEEGLFYEYSGSIYEPFPELRSIANTDSGKNSTVFRDGLYFRMGNQQEWEDKNSTLTERTPEIYAPGISQYAYPCVARAHDESWVYHIIKRAANDLAILAGREEYVGDLRWVWHEIRSIDLTDIETAIVCSVEGRPFLYLGPTSPTENVYKVYLPVTNDATADAGYKFHTAGSLWTPRYMSLLFAVSKRWRTEYLRSVSLSATNYINVQYSTDDGGSWTLLKKFITSPEQTEAFTAIEATMMNLRFDFVGDDEDVPPVILYHNLKAMTLMPSVTRFYHTVKCADGLRLKGNHVASPSYTYAVIRAFVDTLRDKVVTLGDRQGNEHSVLVRVGKEVEVFDEETHKPELLYDIEAVKL